MSPSQDFWSQDRTTLHQKFGWFDKLPTLQKISFTLLLLFIIGWCFFLGMTYALAIAPEREWVIVNDPVIGGKEPGDDIMEPTRLTGTDVILIVGADKRPGETRYRTDTIILAFYNWDADQLNLLSIPRDSYVEFPLKSTKTKINEAYFYGGLPLLESVIEYAFGIDVTHCVEIDFAGFLHLIDALGGVEIDVPQRMYKPTEDINLKKGPQVLSGYDALAFVRFRDLPMGDIDRIANQQMFMRALISKITSSSIWKAPPLVDIGMKYTNSNYTLTEALKLGAALLKTDLNNIPMYSLPGNGLYIGMVNYWILNKKGTIDIITEITGGEVGTFHIINDGGKGTAKPPVPLDEEEPEELPEEGENAEGEETPSEETENPAAEPDINPAGEPIPENTPEQPVEIPLPQPEQQPVTPEPTLPPEPGESGGVG